MNQLIQRQLDNSYNLPYKQMKNKIVCQIVCSVLLIPLDGYLF